MKFTVWKPTVGQSGAIMFIISLVVLAALIILIVEDKEVRAQLATVTVERNEAVAELTDYHQLSAERLVSIEELEERIKAHEPSYGVLPRGGPYPSGAVCELAPPTPPRHGVLPDADRRAK